MFKDRYNRDVYSVVKLKVSGNIFTGYADNCWTKDLLESEHILRAERYWSNDRPTLENPTHETIVNGRIEVLEIVKDYELEGEM